MRTDDFLEDLTRRFTSN